MRVVSSVIVTDSNAIHYCNDFAICAIKVLNLYFTCNFLILSVR